MMELTRRAGIFLRVDAERAAHPEMHDEDVAPIQIGEQIFGPPPEAGNSSALQARGEALRQGEAEVRPPLFHFAEARADHGRLQPAADGLNFGKFGH